MVSEGRGDDPASKSPKTSYFPGWGRLGEFVLNLLRLEGAVEALKKDNKELNDQLRDLQRQVDEQSGKLDILTDFVTKALDDQVRTRAEAAAVRAFERMAMFGGFEPGRAKSENQE